eukprot:11409934-Alexandrium_andersonii.AAC.1
MRPAPSRASARSRSSARASINSSSPSEGRRPKITPHASKYAPPGQSLAMMVARSSWTDKGQGWEGGASRLQTE